MEMGAAEWRGSRIEEIIDPELPIIDSHHHVWRLDRAQSGGRYAITELQADTRSGHLILATVAVEAFAHYREDGPEALRPVGETEFLNAIANEAERVGTAARLCAGIVSNARFESPDAADILDSHLAASPRRMRGCRQINIRRLDDLNTEPTLYDDPAFRRGYMELAPRGLSFDAYCFHPDIPQVTRLARDMPDVPLVLDHLGSPLGVGPWADRKAEAWGEWRASLTELARCPNSFAKLGGKGMRWVGLGWEGRERRASSDEIAAAIGDHFRYAIDLFGPERCMFESNFPVDGISYGYPVIWNAFKKIAAPYSDAERRAMFFGTANRFYRLGLAGTI